VIRLHAKPRMANSSPVVIDPVPKPKDEDRGLVSRQKRSRPTPAHSSKLVVILLAMKVLDVKIIELPLRVQDVSIVVESVTGRAISHTFIKFDLNIVAFLFLELLHKPVTPLVLRLQAVCVGIIRGLIHYRRQLVAWNVNDLQIREEVPYCIVYMVIVFVKVVIQEAIDDRH
jgi:hypothetical protein